ncbi:MAG: DUF1824 family protein [Cyanobacteria bacterium]|nr:DUF1824 family protein [Cyanobacteriota bacterium]
MTSPSSSTPAPRLTLAEATQVLAALTNIDVAPPLSGGQRLLVQRALQVVTAAADRLILGICAPDLPQALASLRAIAAGLGQPLPEEEPELRGDFSGNPAAYCKCNLETGLFYASPYGGEHRGILVVCQSADPAGMNAIYGHLPLDLFP